jgi:hypothetical protein
LLHATSLNSLRYLLFKLSLEHFLVLGDRSGNSSFVICVRTGWLKLLPRDCDSVFELFLVFDCQALLKSFELLKMSSCRFGSRGVCAKFGPDFLNSGRDRRFVLGGGAFGIGCSALLQI